MSRFSIPSIIGAFVLSMIVSAFAVEGPPGLIDYQGQLLNSLGGPITGSNGPGSTGTAANFEIRFRIWDAQTSGNLIWAEKQIVTVSADGFFSVRLGDGEVITAQAGDPLPLTGSVPNGSNALLSVFDGKERFLGVTVMKPPATPGEIQPRLAFLASPFAMIAERARYAEFGPSGGIFSAEGIGVGTTTPETQLHVQGKAYIQESPIGPPAIGRLGGDGTRIILSPGSAAEPPFGFGVGNFAMWSGVPAGSSHKWYTGTVESMSLKDGDLTVNRNLNLSGQVTSPLHVSGHVTGVTSGNRQGAHLEWNKDGGSGLTYLLNNKGGGGGGIVFGDVTNSNVYTENMRIQTNGNVGIGTASPSQKLDVSGSANVSGSLTTGTLTTGNINIDENNYFDDDTTPGGHNDDWMRLNGFVEMKSNTDNFGLVLRDKDNDNWLALTQYDGASYLSDTAGRDTGHFLKGDGSNITVPGRIGIGLGTAAPSYPLEVKGSVPSDFQLEAHLGTTGAHDNTNDHRTDLSHSIVTDGRMRAITYDVESDARIKKVLRLSDGAEDLATLNSIEIADYEFKNSIDQGKRPQKKVIAQQVETVFPQAVGTTTRSIPDIYQKAPISGGWVELETDLQIGDRVRLISSKDDSVHEVIDVQEGKFKTAFEPDTEFVFVYGREVNDFRVVDYDAISMLNVSATQQIKREKDAEVKALQVENAALRSQLATLAERFSKLSARDEARETKLSAIEKRLCSLDPQGTHLVSLHSETAAK